jgi:dTDP-4-amino-4,6-dideoxygalactose transaminase
LRFVHIRINIPAWGWREPLRGALSLVKGGYAARLRDELAAYAPAGWTPHLLASARYGLKLAVEGLQVKRVAVPGYVCPAVLTGLRAAGAEIVAVDVAPSSFRFDGQRLTDVARAGKIDAILAANTYGLDQDYDFLRALNRPVIEDAAYQAGYGACGFRGDAGVWSFNFKALTGVGGGVLWVADGGWRMADGKSQISNQLGLFANYAARAVFREHLPKALGGAAPPSAEAEAEPRATLQEMRAGPMTELQAALALTQWRRRDKLAARQRANSAALERAVAQNDSVALPRDAAGQTRVHLFPLLVKEVLRVRRALYERGVQTETPYPVLLGGRDALPNAHDLAARLVLAPCHASLGERQINRIRTSLEL